jgi:hypothetical protein
MMFRLYSGIRLQWLQLLWVAALIFAGGVQQAGLNTGGGMIIRSHYHRPSYTFPNGGRTLFPRYRLVALYGTPDVPVLGALGQQPLKASIARAKQLAAQYQPLIAEHVLPAMEIIATVASGTPEDNGSYSYPVDRGKLLSWIIAAEQNGVYVVLDLQPGREDFLSQAQRLKALLEYPNVGLALDPEWRLTPQQVPLEQIGSVNIGEVNKTAAWLAALAQQHKLPQKLFLLHEFRTSMLPERSRLDTAYPELAYVVQMDGQGTQPQKLDTWNGIMADPPQNIRFGWKNFYEKDVPMRSPGATMQLTPPPWYISYQ